MADTKHLNCKLNSNQISQLPEKILGSTFKLSLNIPEKLPSCLSRLVEEVQVYEMSILCYISSEYSF